MARETVVPARRATDSDYTPQSTKLIPSWLSGRKALRISFYLGLISDGMSEGTLNRGPARRSGFSTKSSGQHATWRRKLASKYVIMVEME